MQSICVFCGSSDKVNGAYLEAARQMGEEAARRGMRIVYGGGSTGLMGALSRAAMEAGGEVVGILPEFFNTKQLADGRITRMEIVPDMHTRKARMAELAEAFVALPGGYGTLEELFEALTWSQVGLHHKPVGLLNTKHYFDPLVAFLTHVEREGFTYAEHQALYCLSDTPTALLDSLADYRPPKNLERWVRRGD